MTSPAAPPAHDSVDPGRRRVLNWFLGTSVGGLLAAVVYPVIRFVIPPEVPEATTNQVEAGPGQRPGVPDKGFKIVRFGADPVIVIRVDEGDFRAFSATCTHLDCIVEYQREHARIWCNCHNGQYDLHGKNVGGPPPKPLERVHRPPHRAGHRPPATVVVSRA